MTELFDRPIIKAGQASNGAVFAESAGDLARSEQHISRLIAMSTLQYSLMMPRIIKNHFNAYFTALNDVLHR